jgi:hypothetical protein
MVTMFKMPLRMMNMRGGGGGVVGTIGMVTRNSRSGNEG